jgi:hypothetical protein
VDIVTFLRFLSIPIVFKGMISFTSFLIDIDKEFGVIVNDLGLIPFSDNLDAV